VLRGATGHRGGWYAGLAGTPAWATAVPPVDPDMAAAARNPALVTVTALLLGLVGAVLGAWLASGEPMSLMHYRRRTLDDSGVERPRRGAYGEEETVALVRCGAVPVRRRRPLTRRRRAARSPAPAGT
jgi:hypothetical protein